jgi:hypothetical protein
MKKYLLMGVSLLLVHLVSAQTRRSDSNKIVTGMEQYRYIPPQDWNTKKGNGFITFTQPPSNGQSCVLTLISPQQSSGNLGTDAQAIFSQMYQGWKFNYDGERQYEFIKGRTKQGLEYCMMEASMVRQRPGEESWDYETGAAVAIGIGKQMAIVALRHEPIGLYCKCRHRYDYWGRFLSSFAVENFSPVLQGNEADTRRIIGSWMFSGQGTIGEYIFAANGRYQYIGGYGSVTQITREMIEIKSSVFDGDGSYTIQGDKISFRKKGQAPESNPFRFEIRKKGTGTWTDYICIVNEHPPDGGKPYEVCYEKRARK